MFAASDAIKNSGNTFENKLNYVRGHTSAQKCNPRDSSARYHPMNIHQDAQTVQDFKSCGISINFIFEMTLIIATLFRCLRQFYFVQF